MSTQFLYKKCIVIGLFLASFSPLWGHASTYFIPFHFQAVSSDLLNNDYKYLDTAGSRMFFKWMFLKTNRDITEADRSYFADLYKVQPELKAETDFVTFYDKVVEHIPSADVQYRFIQDTFAQLSWAVSKRINFDDGVVQLDKEDVNHLFDLLLPVLKESGRESTTSISFCLNLMLELGANERAESIFAQYEEEFKKTPEGLTAIDTFYKAQFIYYFTQHDLENTRKVFAKFESRNTKDLNSNEMGSLIWAKDGNKALETFVNSFFKDNPDSKLDKKELYLKILDRYNADLKQYPVDMDFLFDKVLDPNLN